MSKNLVRFILIQLTSGKHNALIQKLVDNAKSKEWDVKETKNACDYVQTLSGEMIVSFFNLIMETDNLDNIRKIHKLIGKKVVEIVNASEKLTWK